MPKGRGRTPLGRLALGFLAALLLGAAGCATAEKEGGGDASPERKGLISLLSKSPGGGEAGEQPAGVPRATREEVGSVHLVHGASRFVLVRTSRTAALPADAEMLTYDAGGKPTGKIRLSPERKAGFLAADIVAGNPKANDRVFLHGYRDETGGFRHDAAALDEVEVLD